MASKSKIDKAGRFLSEKNREYDNDLLELELIFDDFRRDHLTPLTKLTLELQNWLQSHGVDYYIAQRLKRKPQILRKLKRFSVRLTQLQDIGGCRIIVDGNSDVDDMRRYITDKFEQSTFAKVIRQTDYREKGRDDTGYRALHIILEVSGCMLELQIRSKIQHYWSESIERTSVIYGCRLKEKEGDHLVIDYFKEFSNILFHVEVFKEIPSKLEIDLQSKREIAESIIQNTSGKNTLSGFVNQSVIKSMTSVENGHTEQINNWILVFDWADGNFVTWEMVSRDPDEAVKAYLRYESEFPEGEKKEVVMIGTSAVATIQHTHSHYFGIDHHNQALEGMESSIIGISNRSKIDVGAKRILMTMKSKRFWGKKTVKTSTLKNHLCKNIATFDYSLEILKALELISGIDLVSLSYKKKDEIDKLV
jgi:ppGpp synthetase/RelA/SpoT-type nucleotidyltranferase